MVRRRDVVAGREDEVHVHRLHRALVATVRMHRRVPREALPLARERKELEALLSLPLGQHLAIRLAAAATAAAAVAVVAGPARGPPLTVGADALGVRLHLELEADLAHRALPPPQLVPLRLPRLVGLVPRDRNLATAERRLGKGARLDEFHLEPRLFAVAAHVVGNVRRALPAAKVGLCIGWAAGAIDLRRPIAVPEAAQPRKDGRRARP